MEKTKIANFNEKVNRGIGYILNSQELFIYRTGTIKEFARMIHDDLYLLTNTYRLFIQYKTTHRVKKLAGRCFMWDETEETRNGIDVESGEQGFGEPRFDGVWSALFITDERIVAFGDARLIADEEIGQGGKDILCRVYLRGRLAEQFKVRRKIFLRIFEQGWVEK